MSKLALKFGDWLSSHRYALAWAAIISSVVISVFIRSPFGFFDEQVHYIRAIGVGSGQLLSYSNDDDDSGLGHAVDSSNLEYRMTILEKAICL